MKQTISEVIERIAELPADWHGAGSVDVDVLHSIARHAETIGPIRHSVETGSGKTTLLFSHLSADHRVFAAEGGNSITRVRESPLFRADAVTYVEGPTQRTLPTYQFTNQVQIALIDGPHGYPFPDLEYYYFYPIIEAGGLLLVDDIPIPTIARMFDIIKSDDMFELLEVVSGNMAVFRRTSNPLIDPYGDDWWLQGYNRSHYEKVLKGNAGRSLVRRALAAVVPKTLQDRIPERIKDRLRRVL